MPLLNNRRGIVHPCWQQISGPHRFCSWKGQREVPMPPDTRFQALGFSGNASRKTVRSNGMTPKFPLGSRREPVGGAVISCPTLPRSCPCHGNCSVGCLQTFRVPAPKDRAVPKSSSIRCEATAAARQGLSPPPFHTLRPFIPDETCKPCSFASLRQKPLGPL
jgi:hypothetical protein